MGMKIKPALVIVSLVILTANALAQVMPKEELVFLTSEWKGERFADGRPKVPTKIIERAKHIGFESAWTILKGQGYNNQFEGGWKMVNDTVQVVGRVVTAQYMPSRPDVEAKIKERGKMKAAKATQTRGR